MIKVSDLHKSFGSKNVLKGVSVEFDKPGTTAVLGPNASGKTTLIKSVLGMVIPDKGEITFDGNSVLRQWAYRDRIGYLPQIARFPENLLVHELISMIKSFRDRENEADSLIDEFRLEPALGQKLGHLSGGTRQKVNLVLALMYDCPVIILDEPSAGLDPVAMQVVKKLIRKEKEKGKIILLTTHVMGLVEDLADHIIFILDGKIYFEGTTSALLERNGSVSVEESIASILTSQGTEATNTL